MSVTAKRKPRSAQGLARYAAQLLLQKKAKDVVIMDVRRITDFTDFFVVCSADSDTHLKAVAEGVLDGMNDFGIKPYKSEGWTAAQWVILDFVEVVVHIFYHETRAFYKIERLWAEAKIERVSDTPEPSVSE